MKNKGLMITLIIILTIIIIALTTFLASVLKNDKTFFFNIGSNKISNSLVIDDSYERSFDNINISSDAAEVYVKNSLDDKVSVKVYSETKDSSSKIIDGKLEVKLVSKKCVGICFNVKRSKVEVYVPSNYDKKITIKNNYGDVTVDYFKNAKIDVNEKAGDVSLKGANEINVNNNYGDTKIGRVSKLNVNEDCGDVEIKKVGYAVIKNAYGDIQIEKVLRYANVQSNCGDVEINDLNVTENSKIKNDFGDIRIGKTNEIYIDAKTDLGDLDINRNSRTSTNTLTIRNSCGDIEVEN